MPDNFTDRFVKSLKSEAGKQDRMYFDAVVTGLGVRVGRSGVKTFILQARTRTGRTRRTPLGRFRCSTSRRPRWKRARR